MKFIKVTIVAGLVIAAASAELAKEKISSNPLFGMDEDAVFNYIAADFVMVATIIALLTIVAFSPAMRAAIKNNILKGGFLVAIILPWFIGMVTRRILSELDIAKSKASVIASVLSTAVSIGLSFFYSPFIRNLSIVIELIMLSVDIKSYFKDRRFDKIFD